MKNKKIVFLLIVVVIIIMAIVVTYALFESKTNGILKIDSGKWKIILNGEDISNGVQKEFYIDSVQIEGSKYVKEGKFAPGMNGYFDINIEVTADVAVRYDITFDTSKIDNESINITDIKATTNNEDLIKTGENTYTKIYTLQEAKNGIESTVQAVIEWKNDENYNEKDTIIGKTVDYNIKIPVKVEITQYLGEEVKDINDI